MNTRRTVLAIGLVGAGGLFGFGLKMVLAAGIPTANPLYYSGTLTESGQLVNASRQFTVNLWTNATPTTGETALCVTNVAATPVLSGRFRIALDASCKSAINANPDAYVEVVVGGTTSLGRSKIGAVPYAVEADHAASATNATNATTAAKATSVAVGSIRLEAVNCVQSAGNAWDCTCTANEVAISGGAYSGGAATIINATQWGPSYGASAQTWRTSCADGTTLARVNCVQPFAVCLAVQ